MDVAKIAPALIAVALVSLFVDACASAPIKTPEQARVVVYESLAAIQDSEEVIHAGGQITDSQHQAFNAALVPVLKAGLAFDRVARVWTMGAKVPDEVRVLIAQLGEFSQHVVALIADSSAQASILAAILQARQVIDHALLNFVGGAK